MTTGRTRSCLRARLLAKLRTGRLQRSLVQTELPEARTAGRGSHFRAHGGEQYFCISGVGLRQGDGRFIRFVTSALVGKRPQHVLLHGESAEVPSALVRRCAACKRARMSHKERPTFYQQELNKTMWEVPERYQNLSPVGSGAYGSVWYGISFAEHLCRALQNERAASTGRRGLSE